MKTIFPMITHTHTVKGCSFLRQNPQSATQQIFLFHFCSPQTIGGPSAGPSLEGPQTRTPSSRQPDTLLSSVFTHLGVNNHTRALY